MPARLRVSRTFVLPDDLADALIERLRAADAQATGSQITHARSDPKGNELHEQHWPQMRAVLDEWATSGQLPAVLEDLREVLPPAAS